MKFKLSIISLLVSLTVSACDNMYGDAVDNLYGIGVRVLQNSHNNASNQYLRLGGASADSGNSVAVDSSGNLIMTGYVNGTADLNGDADTGDSYETPAGVNGNDDIFITKYDISGIYRWSKRLGGTSADSGNSAAVDSSGNVIVAGFVTGTADVNGDGDTGDSCETPTGGVNGNEDIFITKFDSSGTHQWSKRLGGTGGDRGYSAALDSSGAVIVTGYVNGIADVNGDGDTGDDYETTCRGG